MNEITGQQLHQLIAQADVAPERVKAAARAYFSRLGHEANGALTPEICQEANAFYDHTGFPTIIAEALGLSINELQQALGKEKHKRCGACGKTFSVFARRRLGGYTESKLTLCEECRRAENKGRLEQWKAQEAEVQLDDRHRAQVDAEIQAAVTSGRNPLAIEPLREHLIRLALFWIVGRSTQPPLGLLHYLGSGCMLCGNEDALNLWIANVEAAVAMPENRRLWNSLRYCVDYSPEGDALRSGKSYPRDVEWPPLTTPYQALWRFGPETYFSWVPFLPLLNMPLLILCDVCSPVAGDTTHTPIALGDVQVTKLEEGMVAEALGVRYVMPPRRWPW